MTYFLFHTKYYKQLSGIVVGPLHFPEAADIFIETLVKFFQ